MWPWSVGNNKLASCVAIATFSVLETYVPDPFTNHGPDLWLNNYGHVLCCGTMLSHLHSTFPSLCHWRNVAIMGQVCNLLASEGQGNLLIFCSKFVTHWYTMIHKCLCSQRLVHTNPYCVAFVYHRILCRSWLHTLVVRNWSQCQSLENYCVSMCQLSVQY